MREIVFIVEESQDGGYFARAVNHAIFTQGDTIPELKSMISDAVRCHFEEADHHPQPRSFKNRNHKCHTYRSGTAFRCFKTGT